MKEGTVLGLTVTEGHRETDPTTLRHYCDCGTVTLQKVPGSVHFTPLEPLNSPIMVEAPDLNTALIV